jgi:hypothetical protein
VGSFMTSPKPWRVYGDPEGLSEDLMASLPNLNCLRQKAAGGIPARQHEGPYFSASFCSPASIPVSLTGT